MHRGTRSSSSLSPRVPTASLDTPLATRFVGRAFSLSTFPCIFFVCSPSVRVRLEYHRSFLWATYSPALRRDRKGHVCHPIAAPFTGFPARQSYTLSGCGVLPGFHRGLEVYVPLGVLSPTSSALPPAPLVMIPLYLPIVAFSCLSFAGAEPFHVPMMRRREPLSIEDYMNAGNALRIKYGSTSSPSKRQNTAIPIIDQVILTLPCESPPP